MGGIRVEPWEPPITSGRSSRVERGTRPRPSSKRAGGDSSNSQVGGGRPLRSSNLRLQTGECLRRNKREERGERLLLSHSSNSRGHGVLLRRRSSHQPLPGAHLRRNSREHGVLLRRRSNREHGEQPERPLPVVGSHGMPQPPHSKRQRRMVGDRRREELHRSSSRAHLPGICPVAHPRPRSRRLLRHSARVAPVHRGASRRRPRPPPTLPGRSRGRPRSKARGGSLSSRRWPILLPRVVRLPRHPGSSSSRGASERLRAYPA